MINNMNNDYMVEHYNLDEVNAVCDKYDCLVSVGIGVCAGLVDIFFVGTPEFSRLGTVSDKSVDGVIMKLAKAMGWSHGEEKTHNIASAIGFLERKYSVNYDQSHSSQTGYRAELTPKNHHLKSLAHSPDIVGLIFSILNQFTNTSSFVSNGKIITIQNDGTSFTLQGNNFISKLYCGCCNWLGHLLSDVAGSSGNRGAGGRGMGIPMPFMELFQLCDFGKLSGKTGEMETLSKVMEEVFVNGYDARFAVTMSIPVVLQTLLTKIFWVIKRRFYKKNDWRCCIPDNSHGDLRVMILVGNAALCLVDGSDAIIRSGGNAFLCIMRLNIVAWYKLIVLAIAEIRIRYGSEIAGKIMNACRRWMGEDLIEYYKHIDQKDIQLKKAFDNFLQSQERAYSAFVNKLDEHSFLEAGNKNVEKSAEEVARLVGVSQSEIDELNDLDTYFQNRN